MCLQQIRDYLFNVSTCMASGDILVYQTFLLLAGVSICTNILSLSVADYYTP